MSKAQRTFKGGSIANFVVIGIILSVLLVGGVYLIRQRGDQVRKEQAIAEYEEQKKSEQKSNEESKESESDETSNNGSNGEATETSNGGSAELPQTGPDSNVLGLVAVFVLTFMSVSLAGSYRKLKTSL